MKYPTNSFLECKSVQFENTPHLFVTVNIFSLFNHLSPFIVRLRQSLQIAKDQET